VLLPPEEMLHRQYRQPCRLRSGAAPVHHTSAASIDVVKSHTELLQYCPGLYFVAWLCSEL
jgi:hypothetical protein